MTLKDLEDAIAEILPDAEILDDEIGQLVIYTNKMAICPTDDRDDILYGIIPSSEVQVVDYEDQD